MSATTDFEHRIAAWLETAGPADVRPEIVDAALATVRQTRRRRGIRALIVGPAPWPSSRRRDLTFTHVPPAVRIAIVAALALAAIAGSIIAGSRLLLPSVPPRVYEGVFVPTSAPPAGAGDTLVALGDGRVLYAGATWPTTHPASIWDPETGRWTDTGSMVGQRDQPHATLLRDGRVLFLGGDIVSESPGSVTSGHVGPPTSEVFDPKTGMFSANGPPVTARWGFSTALLADGRLLITGGIPPDAQTPLSAAEIYDPATGSFAPTGSMTEPRLGHSMAVLRDGRVLVVGSISRDDPNTPVLQAELYDPATGTFSITGAIAPVPEYPTNGVYPPRQPAGAVTLPDGRVLIPGWTCGETHSLDTQGRSEGFATTRTELYDPSTGTFTLGAPMPHCVGTADALPDGRVFVSGWWYERVTGDESRAETDIEWSGLYDPRTGRTQITGAPPGDGPYKLHAPLPDGRFLFMGTGTRIVDGVDVLSLVVEVFQ